jgi:hypothetical protein
MKFLKKLGGAIKRVVVLTPAPDVIRVTLTFNETDGPLYHEVAKIPGARGSRGRARRVIELATKGMIFEDAYHEHTVLPTASELDQVFNSPPRRIRIRTVTTKHQMVGELQTIKISLSIRDSVGPIFGLLSEIPAAIGTRHRVQRLSNLATAGLVFESFATQGPALSQTTH